MPIIHITGPQQFEELIKSQKHVVVDFYSTECPPCENLAPIYESMAEKYPDISFLKIIRQDNRELAQSLFVMSSPTILFFREGKMLENRLSGNVAKQELEQGVNELING